MVSSAEMVVNPPHYGGKSTTKRWIYHHGTEWLQHISCSDDAVRLDLDARNTARPAGDARPHPRHPCIPGRLEKLGIILALLEP